MPLCIINKEREALPLYKVCQQHLNHWPTMRQLVVKHLAYVFGTATHENNAIQLREAKRLENLWKRDKTLFAKELNAWDEI
ncbi:MAG TPA: hypothetical protein VD794_00595 [Flavisolibacter sp.]|nr:hypothetical protein [Flavisolibacter sp.]